MTQTSAPPLSTLLRDGTATAHQAAESSPFLLALAHGRVTRAGVVGLLQRLLPVYDELEQVGVSWAGDPEIGPLLVPGLERTPSLRADLDALGALPSTSSAASLEYATRVRAAGSTSAPAYLAHHYTRYLGDLSGGQVVGNALRTSLGLDLAFFRFPALRGPVVKREYRAHLDALAWDPVRQERAVAESALAFRFNQDLAAELVAEIVPAGEQVSV